MRNLIRNMKPYKGLICIMLVLLMVQAWADMSLPQYTSDIIDTGIQNKGVEHILPEKIQDDEYQMAQIFMDNGQKTSWQKAYKKTDAEKDGKIIYKRKNLSKEKLDKLDKELLTPVVLTYQLGHMQVKQYKEVLVQSMEKNPESAAMAGQISSMSIEQISKMPGVNIRTFKAEDQNGKTKTYVDARPSVQAMIQSGAMDQNAIDKMKEQNNKIVNKTGDQTLKSMGIAYAADCSKKAGMDMNKIQMDYLWHCGLIMFLMAGLMMVMSVLVSFFASRVGANIGRDLRGQVFSRVMKFSSAEMSKFHTSSLITRATNDIQQVQMVSTMLLRMVLYSPILAVWGIVKVAETKAHMNYVIVGGVMVIVFMVMILMVIAMPKFKVMQKLVDKLNGVSREILTGLQVIRAFGREDVEEARFDQANLELKKTQLFTNRVMTFMRPIMMLIMYTLTVIITWVAAHRIDSGDLQVGAMTAFITYSMIIVISFMIITVMSILLPRAGVAADRIREVIDTEPSINEKEEAKELKVTDGIVEFSHVDFKYPDAEENIITDISFTAKPGETTAIIGSTGCGKSTLVSLIPRFYDVTGGSIKIDGQDIRDVTIKSLRDAIGFVQQKGVLFSGTISSNLKFGNDQASEEVVKSAADTAQASDFIEEKEEGFDSFISQGGSNVSGGQKQRLSIARAIVKDPAIMVFDDSFSALDMKTDAKLRKALDKKVKNTTKIIVAQRVGTILHAEQILVLDEGRIVGRGTHEQLMKSCDEYKQIAESQLSSLELEGRA
ncbi:MAG: ABC transporter ATP-binding protein/permease [Clostridiales bacterium]|uniref:ABC transporter ATP-binding protein n=1 Tax=Baileyella intestinalis TaxID=2606709 RepID=UPI002A75538C|nr:ABC transporter ATP-binding protein [Baileyella intestinalis]MCI7685176.1 ABC transporter ATP-binding protein/permease [Clostridiales bacterium]